MSTKKPAAKGAGISIAELRKAIKASGLPVEQVEAIDAILAQQKPTRARGRPRGSFDFAKWSLMPVMELMVVEHGLTEEQAASSTADLFDQGWLDAVNSKLPTDPVGALLRMYQDYKDPSKRRMHWAPGHEPKRGK